MYGIATGPYLATPCAGTLNTPNSTTDGKQSHTPGDSISPGKVSGNGSLTSNNYHPISWIGKQNKRLTSLGNAQPENLQNNPTAKKLDNQRPKRRSLVIPVKL